MLRVVPLVVVADKVVLVDVVLAVVVPSSKRAHSYGVDSSTGLHVAPFIMQ
jgi:hypothetical protein